VIPAAGVHGQMRRAASGRVDAARIDQRVIAEVHSHMLSLVGHEQGLYLETKFGAVALHYRARPELEDFCCDIARFAVEPSADLQLVHGKMVVEVKFAGYNKGTAIRAFMQEARLPDAALFAGDDDGRGWFAVVNALGGDDQDRQYATSAAYRLLARGSSSRLDPLAHVPSEHARYERPQPDDRQLRLPALIDRKASIVWCCLPRFDGDPVFHGLLGSPAEAGDGGVFAIDMQGLTKCEQCYVPNTAILKTTLHGTQGTIEVTDFAPRFLWHNRSFRPQMIVRRLQATSGSPRLRLRVRPRFDFGATAPVVTRGSNHIRYVGPRFALRLTTDAPIDYLIDETYFDLRESLNIVLGADETLPESAADTARSFEESTETYWRQWVHRLAIPFEWQEAVIRAAITLKLCTYEPTGGIVAAITTSIPEAPGTERNWDYRLCWVRDAYFVVRALNSLSAMRTMENYLDWPEHCLGGEWRPHQPVLRVGTEASSSSKW
jgi:hypothetical protein